MSLSRSVLIVEDDEGLRSSIEMFLEMHGLTVQLASNGKEALALIETSMPGLILLDMKMPVMDGWEFMRQFKSRYTHPTPIIVISAAEDARKRAEEIGANCGINKPFDLNHLISTVMSFLDQNS